MRYAFLLLASLASCAFATLSITEPSAAHWWVGNNANTLAWDGKDPAEFSVFLANPDVNILTSMLALASIVPTYQTSLTMNPGDATPATGYTILVTNPLNSSDVYATSDTFEIKKEGSSYPPQGVAVNASATAEGTGTQAGSGLASVASATSSSSSSSSQMGKEVVSYGALGLVAVSGLIAFTQSL
ncbi:hypothetical protein B9479_005225 [Cryptococcus floricola]|uniref:Yeast cell wall synthesis Kre9/Knh1-like N-terminal domain-containing protein n=1 Tax=Cryptococcus floricola TaxID=2591691 RepID=A0A5D3ARJ0_9TREE|nr:hypothetical protein B9479_005225 [Cryptococcus floricola]